MKKFTYYKNDTVFIIIIILIFLLGIHMYFRNNDFNQNRKYTLGTTLKTYITKSGTLISYNFKYLGNYYGGSERHVNFVKVPNGRYLVGFSSKNPTNCKMYFEYEIPNTFNIRNVPSNGWDNIPKFIIDFNKAKKNSK